jgi:O-antigen ligase
VVAQQHLLGAAAAGSEPAHNVLVIALAELGQIGVSAWLWLIGSLLFAAWLRRSQPRGAVGPLFAVTVLSPLLLRTTTCGPTRTAASC